MRGLYSSLMNTVLFEEISCNFLASCPFIPEGYSSTGFLYASINTPAIEKAVINIAEHTMITPMKLNGTPKISALAYLVLSPGTYNKFTTFIFLNNSHLLFGSILTYRSTSTPISMHSAIIPRLEALQLFKNTHKTSESIYTIINNCT